MVKGGYMGVVRVGDRGVVKMLSQVHILPHSSTLCMYVCLCVCMHMYVCVCVYICLCVYAYVCVRV